MYIYSGSILSGPINIYITVQTIVPLAYNPPSYKYISIIYIIILVLASGISLYIYIPYTRNQVILSEHILLY